MSVATSTAIIIAGGVAAAGTAYAAHEAAGGQEQAAQTQSDAATKASQIQSDAANKALDFEKQVYNTKQGQVSPYLGYGQGALSAIGMGLGVTPVAQPPTPGTVPPGTQTLGLPQSISGGNWAPPGPLGQAAQQAAQQAAGGGTGPQTPKSGQIAAGAGGSGLQLPQAGQTGIVNGVPAVWDGTGWKAQTSSSVGAS